MTKRNGVFVKINYRNMQKKMKESGKNLERKNESSYTKFLLCAGIINRQGGTMIFRAKDMEEAEEIANNNPFVYSDIYKYEILNGDVIRLS